MLKIHHLLLALVMGITLSGLTGCGFQLRNHNELAATFHTLYVQTDNPYDSLGTTLRQTLRASGIKLVDSPSLAPITLQLSSLTQSNSNALIGPSSQSRTYTVNFKLTFTLLNSQGQILMGPQTLSTSRTLILNPNELPQSNNQMDVLSKGVEKDIVDQLYNRLRSKQIEQALRPHTHENPA